MEQLIPLRPAEPWDQLETMLFVPCVWMLYGCGYCVLRVHGEECSVLVGKGARKASCPSVTLLLPFPLQTLAVYDCNISIPSFRPKPSAAWHWPFGVQERQVTSRDCFHFLEPLVSARRTQSFGKDPLLTNLSYIPGVPLDAMVASCSREGPGLHSVPLSRSVELHVKTTTKLNIV